MSAYRYLLNIAYIGTSFRGVQRQVVRYDGNNTTEDPLTIQGRIEMALKVLKPVNEPITKLSSRTDKGVHAMNSTCHVDLIRYGGEPYDTSVMTIQLNKYFSRHELPIRVLKTYIVPNTFHCRKNAISRTYLYRIMLATLNDSSIRPQTTYMPIEELDRCFLYCINEKEFDLDLMSKCAKMMEGYHDFRTFMNISKDDRYKITRRTIEYIKIIHEPIKNSYSFYSWPSSMLQENVQYSSLNIYIKSSGFLYRQVRKTIAALAAVAQGKVTIKDIKFMLEVPSYRSWCPRIKPFPAQGLYLCEVEYSKEDLATFKTIREI